MGLPSVWASSSYLPVNLAGEDGITLCLGQTVEMHLLVEEVNHLLLVTLRTNCGLCI